MRRHALWHLPLAVAAVAMACAPSSCRSPTEISVVVSTDFGCADLHRATVTVGTLGDALEKAPITTVSTTCNGGYVGTVVVVPSGGDGDLVAIKVVGGFGAAKNAEECAPAPGSSPPDYGQGCIVARRALRYTPHTPLKVAVVLHASCNGVPCGETQTCIGGACVPAMIPDPAACQGSGCGDGVLGGGDAGSSHWTAMASPASIGLAARDSHTAVWTGRAMIVWGGALDSSFAHDGAAYEPARDVWTKIATPNLANRVGHIAAWTDTEMVVWGGAAGASLWADGARYDPAKDTWTPMSAPPGSFPGRTTACAVWAKATNEVLIWGGGGRDASTRRADGAAYRPATDTWRALPASTLAARLRPGCVWNGTAMVVYGGVCALGADCDDAAAYDPARDSWSPASVAPLGARTPSVSVAGAGSSSIFWGGGRTTTGVAYGDGAIFDPPGTWTPIPAAPVVGRNGAVGWFAGGSLSVWGGESGGAAGRTYLADGASFDAAASAWRALPKGGPSPRSFATAVWTGKSALIWGGATNNSVEHDDGMIFVP